MELVTTSLDQIISNIKKGIRPMFSFKEILIIIIDISSSLVYSYLEDKNNSSRYKSK